MQLMPCFGLLAAQPLAGSSVQINATDISCGLLAAQPPAGSSVHFDATDIFVTIYWLPSLLPAVACILMLQHTLLESKLSQILNRFN